MKYERWDDFEKRIFTKEEIEESDKKAELICSIIEARKEKHLSQRDLENLTGIKQPMIARLESGQSYPRYDTLLKILAALGKTIKIVDIAENKA